MSALQTILSVAAVGAAYGVSEVSSELKGVAQKAAIVVAPILLFGGIAGCTVSSNVSPSCPPKTKQASLSKPTQG